MNVSADTAWRAISALLGYCRAIDEHDEGALVKVFTTDAVLLVSGAGSSDVHRFEGREPVVALLSSLFTQRDWSRHLVSNPLVDDEGSIRVRSYFSFTMATGATRTRGLGTYAATLQNVAG